MTPRCSGLKRGVGRVYVWWGRSGGDADGVGPKSSLEHRPRGKQVTTGGGHSLREAILRELLQACGDRADRECAARVTDQELAALVARLFQQFLSIEIASVAIATDVMEEDQKVRLPGYVANLRGYTLQLLRTGGKDSVDTINDYLANMIRWFAARLSAWERAPNDWWLGQWQAIDPAIIESKPEQCGGFGKWLRNRFEHLWKEYTQQARDLSPPDVKRKISNRARELARDQMENDMKKVEKRSAGRSADAQGSQP